MRVRTMDRGWFGGAEKGLVQSPGRIVELIDRQFRVIAPWPELGVRGMNGRPVLESWKVGTVGIVCALLFDKHNGWEVRVEYKDYPASMEADEVWPEIPLQYFLRCTEPQAVLFVVPNHEQGAANDE
jgi:hypothetical protein